MRLGFKILQTCGISSGTRPIHESDLMMQSPAVLELRSQCKCILMSKQKSKHLHVPEYSSCNKNGNAYDLSKLWQTKFLNLNSTAQHFNEIEPNVSQIALIKPRFFHLVHHIISQKKQYTLCTV
jgi:hypothetical protein